MECWGGNDGSLTSGEEGTTTASATATTLPGISDAIEVEAGESWSCALHATGTVDCWGANGNDELGNTSAGGPTPVAVDGLTDALHISQGWASNRTMCAIRATGDVVCWGSNGSGALGSGSAVAMSTSYMMVMGLP